MSVTSLFLTSENVRAKQSDVSMNEPLPGAQFFWWKVICRISSVSRMSKYC